jgi:hypothetical protein
MRSERAPPSGRCIRTPTIPTFAPTSAPHVDQQSAVSTRMTDTASVDAAHHFEAQKSNNTSLMPIDASLAAQYADAEACYYTYQFAPTIRNATADLDCEADLHLKHQGRYTRVPKAPRTTTNDVQRPLHTDGRLDAQTRAIMQRTFHRQWGLSW